MIWEKLKPFTHVVSCCCAASFDWPEIQDLVDVLLIINHARPLFQLHLDTAGCGTTPVQRRTYTERTGTLECFQLPTSTWRRLARKFQETSGKSDRCSQPGHSYCALFPRSSLQPGGYPVLTCMRSRLAWQRQHASSSQQIYVTWNTKCGANNSHAAPNAPPYLLHANLAAPKCYAGSSSTYIEVFFEMLQYSVFSVKEICISCARATAYCQAHVNCTALCYSNQHIIKRHV